MCGIFGIFSQTTSIENTKILYKSLKLLQHRGKDGYGLCLLNNKHDITFIRNSGLIQK